MANTTNYSWETPDDSDFVKDGASAMRTLGSAADTTVNQIENFKGEIPHPFLLMGV